MHPFSLVANMKTHINCVKNNCSLTTSYVVQSSNLKNYRCICSHKFSQSYLIKACLRLLMRPSQAYLHPYKTYLGSNYAYIKVTQIYLGPTQGVPRAYIGLCMPTYVNLPRYLVYLPRYLPNYLTYQLTYLTFFPIQLKPSLLNLPTKPNTFHTQHTQPTYLIYLHIQPSLTT